MCLCAPNPDRVLLFLQFRRRKEKQLAAAEEEEEEVEEDECDGKEANAGVSTPTVTDSDAELQWINMLVGRVVFAMNRNPLVVTGLQERIQRKLSTIKLPYFIEEITIAELELGAASPRINRLHRPTMDERGLWLDLDLTYEGLVRMSLVTKLNLMKIKQAGAAGETNSGGPGDNLPHLRSAMFHSDVEDSAESSSDDEQTWHVPQEAAAPAATSSSSSAPAASQGVPGDRDKDAKGRKLLRMIDNIASSSLFQQASDNKFIRRAMEGVSRTEIRLTVDLLELRGRLALNVATPPTDRVWAGFRTMPRMQLSARPAIGERAIHLAHLTGWIERRLALEFQKVLVLPNMEDLLCPLMAPDLPSTTAV